MVHEDSNETISHLVYVETRERTCLWAIGRRTMLCVDNMSISKLDDCIFVGMFRMQHKWLQRWLL